MNAKQIKMIEALDAELAAAIATKDAANDALDQDAFDSAWVRIREIEQQIRGASLPKRKGYACPVLADLVAKNID